MKNTNAPTPAGMGSDEFVTCPAIGDIPKHKCREYQERDPKYAAASPVTMLLYRACRSGCPHSKLAKEY